MENAQGCFAAAVSEQAQRLAKLLPGFLAQVTNGPSAVLEPQEPYSGGNGDGEDGSGGSVGSNDTEEILQGSEEGEPMYGYDETQAAFTSYEELESCAQDPEPPQTPTKSGRPKPTIKPVASLANAKTPRK